MMKHTPRDRGLRSFGLVVEALGWAQLTGALSMLVRMLAMPAGFGMGMGGEMGGFLNRFLFAVLAYGAAGLLMAFAGRGFGSGSVAPAKLYALAGTLAS